MFRRRSVTREHHYLAHALRARNFLTVDPSHAASPMIFPSRGTEKTRQVPAVRPTAAWLHIGIGYLRKCRCGGTTSTPQRFVLLSFAAYRIDDRLALLPCFYGTTVNFFFWQRSQVPMARSSSEAGAVRQNPNDRTGIRSKSVSHPLHAQWRRFEELKLVAFVANRIEC